MSPSPGVEEAALEAGLLARIGTGDRTAFRDLYARYSGPLFALAVRLVGDRGAAEELLQDAFVKIWRHAATYDARLARPFTWAVIVQRRTCFDHLRKQRRRPVAVPLPESAAGDGEVARDGNARSAAESHEDAARLQAALGEFSPAQREALELALFSDLSHAEIARHLGQPVGTIKSWIRRGLLGLRTSVSNATP